MTMQICLNASFVKPNLVRASSALADAVVVVTFGRCRLQRSVVVVGGP